MDADPEREATIRDFKRLHSIMGWKSESFKDFMLKDHSESNEGEFEGIAGFDQEAEYDIGDGWYSALIHGEQVFELLSDRNVLELGDKTEPAPMLFAARSPSGNIICVLTVTGWSCG